MQRVFTGTQVDYEHTVRTRVVMPGRGHATSVYGYIGAL